MRAAPAATPRTGAPGGPSITTANTDGNAGTAPGGGGSGAQAELHPAAGGGSGGYCERVFASVAGQTFPVVVGAGGPPGAGTAMGGAGADGRVTVECE
ncbi:MAG TPA: hypothetical protein VM513_13840 [Kofleriaceae bacterium]|nr:hypothetical protein [Kofleriaceae bacterium]